MRLYFTSPSREGKAEEQVLEIGVHLPEGLPEGPLEDPPEDPPGP